MPRKSASERERERQKAAINVQAWRAVQRFRKMQPTLSSFARAITGNPRIRVEATEEGAHSTRNVIYVKLPIEYGENIPHDTMVCYARGEDKQMLCPACKQDDEISFQFYHEGAHVGLGSHVDLTVQLLKDMSEIVLRVWGPDFPKWAQSKHAEIRKTPFEHDAGLLAPASVVHKWLPFTFNVTEDLRVDTQMFAIRPGVRNMSEAITLRIMKEGEVFGDQTMYWRDQPLERQILVAVSFLGFGYSMEYFSDECQAFIASDPVLSQYAERAQSSKDVLGSFRVACELLHHLHTLGMYDPPTEDEDESGDGNESDQNEQSEPGNSESGEGSGGAGDEEGSPDDTEGSGGGRGEDQADGDKSGGGNSPEGEDGEPEEDTSQSGRGDIGSDKSNESEDSNDSGDADPGLPDPEKLQQAMDRQVGSNDSNQDVAEAIKVALVQADYFDEQSTDVVGVRFHPHGQRGISTPNTAWGSHSGYDFPKNPVDKVKPPEGIIGASLMHARRVFSDNHTVHRSRNHRSGRIVGNSLAKRAPFGDDRMFGRKTVPDHKSYFVQVMLDVSGSNFEGVRMDMVREMGGALGELLSRIGGIKFGMHAHTAHYVNSSTFFGGDITLDLYPIKDTDEPWNSTSLERIADLVYADGNLDGHALEWARKRCDEIGRDATHKIILYETDGEMPATNGPEERQVLTRELDVCRRRGYTVLGVGIDTDSPSKYGLETVRVRGHADIGHVVKALERKLA